MLVRIVKYSLNHTTYDKPLELEMRLTNLEHISNFTNTSRLLFYVWEALFQHTQTTWLSSVHTPKHAPSKELPNKFIMFLKHISVEDDNWKFWSDFVL